MPIKSACALFAGLGQDAGNPIKPWRYSQFCE